MRFCRLQDEGIGVRIRADGLDDLNGKNLACSDIWQRRTLVRRHNKI